MWRIPKEDEKTIQHLNEIKKAGDRAKSLTSQLLAFSRAAFLEKPFTPDVLASKIREVLTIS